MSHTRTFISRLYTLALVGIATSHLHFTASAGALGQGLAPVQQAANNVQAFLQGPIARTVVLIAIIICGAMWFLNRQGRNSQTMGGIFVGAIIIFLAVPIFNVLFPNVGASGAAI